MQLLFKVRPAAGEPGRLYQMFMTINVIIIIIIFIITIIIDKGKLGSTVWHLS